MTRHVFPHPRAVSALLVLALALAIGRTARGQDEPAEPPKKAASEGATAEEGATATAEEAQKKDGPPGVGDAFPTHLPIESLEPEGAAARRAAADSDGGSSDSPAGDSERPAPDGKGGDAGEGDTAGAESTEPAGHAVADIVGDEPRPLVVVFWSTKCVVCERYGESLTELAGKLGDRAALAVIVSGGDETAEAARRAFDDAGDRVRVFLDSDLRAAALLGVRVTPTALVIDKGGVLRYRGPIDDDRRARPRDARALLQPAVEAVLAGRDVDSGDVPPFGSAVR